ncbi:MAG TPA: glycosyltransferase [Burkholderiaceae bacterium]|nr:glycosyltransferase [Burkholderiaceae bacterium]
MDRIRVVFVLNALGIGGAERHTLALAKGLSESFDVIVVAVKRALPMYAMTTSMRSECLEVKRRVDFAAVDRLRNLLRRERADVVVCINPYPMLYVHAALRGLRVKPPVVEVFHTTLLRTLKERLQMLLYRPLFRHSDVVFLCEAQALHWQRHGLRSRSTTTIYNGIDVERFEPWRFEAEGRALRRRLGWSDADRVVGLCAIMRPEKAHGLILQAVRLQADLGRRWKVLLIGDGPQRAAIEARAAELGLGDQIAITGMLSDVRPAVAACDVMTLVSVAIETFSIAALESMAMAKPMIMSDIGGAREQVTDGENGWLFPVGDVKALARALERCWDVATTRAMGEAARRRVLETFSEEAMMAAYSALLRRVARGSDDRCALGIGEPSHEASQALER